MAVFWPATRCGFVNFDDDLYITSNTHVQDGLNWAGIKWIFLNPVAANWHPLTMLSHLLDCQIYGLNPWGHHLTSVLLHSFNAALVFLLLQGMTGAMWRSVLVAALFAVHPLHVESVAWVAERKDVLSGCFGLLSLIYYTRYAAQDAGERSGRRRWDYALAFVFLALGLLCKAMLVTWPFVMLLLDYWPLRRLKTGAVWRLTQEKMPFFLLAAFGSIMTLAVQYHAGVVATVGNLPLDARGENAVISYCRYLGKLLYPTNLEVFYPHSAHWSMNNSVAALLLLTVISSLLVAVRRSLPFMLMGWLWFLGTLVPVIGLIQVGDQSMADRYMYLPSLGLLIAVVWGGYELARRWRIPNSVSLAGGGVVTSVCVMLTMRQIEYWQSSETLFRHALAVTKDNYVAHTNLGSALLTDGDLDGAIAQLREALRLEPYDVDALSDYAHALLDKGQFDDAISEYQEVIRLNPKDPEAHENLGNAYFKTGHLDEAGGEYREAIRLKTDDALAYYNLGEVLSRKGQTNEAIDQYFTALRYRPNYAYAQNNLGRLFERMGRIDDAINHYREAIRLKPDYALASNNLARAVALKNKSPSHE